MIIALLFAAALSLVPKRLRSARRLGKKLPRRDNWSRLFPAWKKKTNIPPPTADALRPGQTCSVHRTYTLLHWQQMIRFLGLTSTGAYMHQGRPIVPEPLLTAPIALLLQKMNPVSWKILNTSFTFLGTAPIQEPLYCTLTVKEKQEINRVPHYVFTYTVTDTARKNFLTGTVYGKINET